MLNQLVKLSLFLALIISYQDIYAISSSNRYIQEPSYNFIEFGVDRIDAESSSTKDASKAFGKISFRPFNKTYISLASQQGIGSFTQNMSTPSLTIGITSPLSDGGSFYMGITGIKDMDEKKKTSVSPGFELGIRTAVDRNTEFNLGLEVKEIHTSISTTTEKDSVSTTVITSAKDSHTSVFAEGVYFITPTAGIFLRTEFIKTPVNDKYKNTRNKLGLRIIF